MKSNRLLSLIIFIVSFSSSEAQTLNSENFVFGNTIREYAIYIPSSYDGSTAFPLMFNFHGGGDFITTHMSNVDMRPIADTANFILVYPQAVPDPGNGGSTSWMHKTPTTHNDVPFVQAMIDSISMDYNIDLNRVYACGYSLGGEFTYELGCQLNNEIAAIGAVARTMGAETFNNCSPSHPTGVMTVLGTADPISDYNGIWYLGTQYYMSADEQHNYWVNFNNCDTVPIISAIPDAAPSDGSTVERHSWSNSDGCVYVEQLKVINGGHDWPGSFGNMDIDASEEIWNFVSKYNINGLIGCSTLASSNRTIKTDTDYLAYPNPFSDQITIKMDLTSVKQYMIYNILGELMISGHINSETSTINLSNLPPDIYVFKTDNQAIRIVKTK